MSKLEIKVLVDVENTEHMNALQIFLGSLNTGNGDESPSTETEKEKPIKRTRKKKPAAEQPAAEQPAAEQPAAEQPAAEQPAAEQPAAEPKAKLITLKDIVTLIPTKVNLKSENLEANRSAIRAKLDEFDAVNAKKLDSKHYSEFFKFLNTLED